MEASVVGKETKSYILVEGHMLGAACAMFLKAFGGTASILIVSMDCSKETSKQRRLHRRERSEEETKVLSDYIERYVWPAYLQCGVPALQTLRSCATANPDRDIQFLDLSAENVDSLTQNIQLVLSKLKKKR